MINTKQVVPALVAVTLLSLAPAAEALAIEEHAQAAKPAAVAAYKVDGAPTIDKDHNLQVGQTCRCGCG